MPVLLQPSYPAPQGKAEFTFLDTVSAKLHTKDKKKMQFDIWVKVNQDNPLDSYALCKFGPSTNEEIEARFMDFVRDLVLLEIEDMKAEIAFLKGELKEPPKERRTMVHQHTIRMHLYQWASRFCQCLYEHDEMAQYDEVHEELHRAMHENYMKNAAKAMGGLIQIFEQAVDKKKSKGLVQKDFLTPPGEDFGFAGRMN